MRPGERCAVELELNAVAQAFPAGRRIRLALSTSYRPLAWSPPKPVLLFVHAGQRAGAAGAPGRRAGRAAGPPLRRTRRGGPVTAVTPGEQRWTVSRDLVDYRSALEIVKNAGTVRFDDLDLTVTGDVRERYRWVADDSCSPVAETEWPVPFAHGEWVARSETRTRVSCTDTEVVIDARPGAKRRLAQSFAHA